MRYYFIKILIISILCVFVIGCDATKRVPEGRYLLKENTVQVNGIKTDDAKINNFVIQKPNSYILGMPLSLYIYNLANPKSEQEFASCPKSRWADSRNRF